MNSRRSREWQAWVEKVCELHPVDEDRQGKFQPDPNDAFKLAAMQWWAFTLGRVAIEVYATDRRQYDRMSAILSDATAALHALAGSRKMIADGDACQVSTDCPEGYYCDEGTCEPIRGITPSSPTDE